MLEYEYKKVPSGIEISKKIFDFLEDCDTQNYNGMNRAGKIREINDILHDRGHRGGTLRNVSGIYDELSKWQNSDENRLKISYIRSDIDDFFNQRSKMTFAIVKSNSMGGHEYSLCDNFHNEYGIPLKIITQQCYDNAVTNGFPKDFFKNSYFEGITFYCLPNKADFSHSRLINCKFAVCHCNDANFIKATLTDVNFESVNLPDANFSQANLYHTRFRDSSILYSCFNKATLKGSSMIDCRAFGLDFNNALFYDCNFGRLETTKPKGFDTAKFTMSSATREECGKNRESIYKAFGVPLPQPQKSHRNVGGEDR